MHIGFFVFFFLIEASYILQLARVVYYPKLLVFLLYIIFCPCFVQLENQTRARSRNDMYKLFSNLGRTMSVPEITTEDALPLYAMGMWYLNKSDSKYIELMSLFGTYFKICYVYTSYLEFASLHHQIIFPYSLYDALMRRNPCSPLH